MRKILLLGASGNIGSQSLDIFRNDRESFLLVGFTVGHQIDKIPAILNDFPSVRAVYSIEKTPFEGNYPNVHFYHGEHGLEEIIKDSDCDMVENALVGFSGLVPSITALKCNKILALSNKESLVVGGEIINNLLADGCGSLLPIDSEHVALAKCLSKVDVDDVEEMIITGSGGSFRNLTRDQLENVSVAQALNHPTWSMGAKITIDSATMMNKGFEVIEAHYLYNWPIDNIRVVLHQESCVHSALKLKNGKYIADVCKPDMHGPISYALYERKAFTETVVGDSLESFGPYHFKEFDNARYPAVSICVNALKEGGIKPAILNGANEEAVNLFLKEKIKFTDIEKLVTLALANFANIIEPTLDQILIADKEAREFVRSYAGK